MFFRKIKNPQNILIYKIGNIGDIVCAVPSFIAIRRFYSNAKIALLSSPGERGALGANELLVGARYLNGIKVYYAEDVDSWRGKKNFVKNLRKNRYDLFIQIPDDLANFRTLLRNIFFAKVIGAKSAFGFKIRTVQIFKKTQVDYLSNKTEVESLLDILKENGIAIANAEFDFNISDVQRQKVKNLLNKKWDDLKKNDIIVAISAGGKRETNRWPKERFREVIEYLYGKYGAKIIIIGGSADVSQANFLTQNFKKENYLITAGKVEILETVELLKHCSFLISNSTGAVHLAAAVNLPVIGLFTVRDILGRWFPYGSNHKMLYHKFIDCDYNNENCIKKSIEAISVEEVKRACDEFFK